MSLEECRVAEGAHGGVAGFFAARFLREWRERLRKFGLELHPDKTRLIEFGRFAVQDRKQRGESKPETFNFLGYVFSALMLWKASDYHQECRALLLSAT
jgi:hypothetical protein